MWHVDSNNYYKSKLRPDLCMNAGEYNTTLGECNSPIIYNAENSTLSTDGKCIHITFYYIGPVGSLIQTLDCDNRIGNEKWGSTPP